MIEHQVWFKLRDGWTAEDAAALKSGLLGLAQELDVVYASAGVDFCGRGRGFDFGYIARFATREAYEAYGPHPKHDEFIAAHKHLWQDVMAIDYECKSKVRSPKPKVEFSMVDFGPWTVDIGLQ